MRMEGECGETFGSIRDYREHLWRCPADAAAQARMDHRTSLTLRLLVLVGSSITGYEFEAAPSFLLGGLLLLDLACLIVLWNWA